MHFSIPYTENIVKNGTEYAVYNIHINGFFHCSSRFSQLYSLHTQLCKELGSSNLPSFPPRKILSLNESQIEERRILLEKYILQLSQNPLVLLNDVFNGWLLWAQKETNKIVKNDDVMIFVHLMNGHKFSISVSPSMQTSDVLEKVCKHINLSTNLVSYFALFIMKKDEKISILKRLQDFESPYISQKSISIPAKIVLRKDYWDHKDDFIVAKDKVGLNLIYSQTVAEVESGWVVASRETLRQLASLQSTGSKLQYIELAQTLKYYGYVHFDACVCDFPEPNTLVLVAAGKNELNFRIESEDGEFKEGNFKVTRMRCWRISSIPKEIREKSVNVFEASLELSFEYLMNKEEMRWVKVASSQSGLISLCLQAMVQTLLHNKRYWNPSDRVRKKTFSYMNRHGNVTKVILNRSNCSEDSESDWSSLMGQLSLKKLSQKFCELSNREDLQNQRQNEVFHDKVAKNRDSSTNSHDNSEKNLDNSTKSHENSEKNLDNSTKFHDNSEKSRDNSTKSHDNSKNSQGKPIKTYGNSTNCRDNCPKVVNSSKCQDNSVNSQDNSKNNKDSSANIQSSSFKSNDVLTNTHNPMKNRDNLPKHHDSSSKVHDSSKNHDNLSKVHDSSSKIHDNLSKVHDNSSKSHDNSSKNQGNLSKVPDNSSKIHDNSSNSFDDPTVESISYQNRKRAFSAIQDCSV